MWDFVLGGGGFRTVGRMKPDFDNYGVKES